VKTKDEVEDGENLYTQTIEEKRKMQKRILADKAVVDCKYSRKIPCGLFFVLFVNIINFNFS
jgi:hypothetical protein